MSPTTSRALPDPEISLRDARDFILGSELGRQALRSNEPGLQLFLQDLLDRIYHLVQSCHLPEFTDHGLPHLCSLVDRISQWTLPPSGRGPDTLCDAIQPEEAAILLVATLIHDIGMLSQNPIDLPDSATELQSKSRWSDIAAWVRQTHVDRMEKLVCRILSSSTHVDFLETQLFATAVAVAASHQNWPWEWQGDWSEIRRYRGLAAVVAVTDLLDEDSARCDTAILLKHRDGTELNRAHWLRHALTCNRVVVDRGRVRVEMARPPGTGESLKPVFSAVRNHFRLVDLYNTDLKHLDIAITNIDLIPSTGVPNREETSLQGWQDASGFSTEDALCFQLLRSFMAPALKDAARCDAATLGQLKTASLEDVDTSLLDKCRGTAEPRTESEQTFAAIINLPL